MFFSNIANPVEVTSKSIILAFTNDMAVKQAEDDSKKIPLKNAALKYFGVNDIEIKIIKGSPSDVLKKKSNEIKSEPKEPVKKAATEPLKVKQTIKTEEKTEKTDDKIIENTAASENISSKPVTDSNKSKLQYDYELSDTSRMIIDLFGGKIAD